MGRPTHMAACPTAPADEPWVRPRAAYLHVPFCRHHCGYCDFAVVTGRDHLIDVYLDALEAELSTLGEPDAVSTIFIGGGTPTALSLQQLERLLAMVRTWLPLTDGGEWSVESTPDTLDAGRVAALAEFGVTRVSIGVQSFREPLLRALDRVHSVADVEPACERVKSQIRQVSLDLIFGIPGQSPADWRADLALALALEPDHLSCYGLTFEKGTELWKSWKAGRVVAVPEEDERAMFLDTHDTLPALGWDHYEISNFARPGGRCRHNGVYWANHAYHGFGLSACRYVNGTRESNTRSLDDYVRRMTQGQAPTIASEHLDPWDRGRETVLTQLRRQEGICRPEFQRQVGIALDQLAGSAVARNVAAGLMSDDGTSVALSRDGLVVADTVLTEMWLAGEVETTAS